MGRFGILSGLFVSAVLALSLVGGDGLGSVMAPVAVGSDPTAPSPSTPSAEVTTVQPVVDSIAEAPESPTVVRVESPVTIVETLAVASPEAPAPTVTAPAESETPGAGVDAEFTSDGEFDAAAAALAFGDVEAASGSSPWDTAVKQTAPNQISPAYTSSDPETIARVQALTAQGQSCPGLGSYTSSGAPSKKSSQGVAGTTSADLVSFADQYNLIRYQNCLPPVTRFVYDSCMEARLFWMAESPSPDPLDAWGHIGSKRIDGVPSVGCDGNLAGGTSNTGATVATKWWESLSHRASLYRPPNATGGVCIALAVTHGGIDEPTSFTRAAASWRSC